MHPIPVPQFPFSAASDDPTMVPVSSVKAFLKVFFCSGFIVPIINLLEPRLCQEGLSAVLCPSLSISLYVSLLRSYRKQHRELQISSPGLTETLPPSFSQSALGHLILSWPDQLLLCGALNRKDKLTLASFEDPTALGVWKTTANKACFCCLPKTELKCMTERIMPHSVTKYIFAWHSYTKKKTTMMAISSNDRSTFS